MFGACNGTDPHSGSKERVVSGFRVTEGAHGKGWMIRELPGAEAFFPIQGRDMGVVSREKPNPESGFKKGVDTVQGATGSSSGNGNGVLPDDDAEIFGNKPLCMGTLTGFLHGLV